MHKHKIIRACTLTDMHTLQNTRPSDFKKNITKWYLSSLWTGHTAYSILLLIRLFEMLWPWRTRKFQQLSTCRHWILDPNLVSHCLKITPFIEHIPCSSETQVMRSPMEHYDKRKKVVWGTGDQVMLSYRELTLLPWFTFL